jgi:hypothetical protein
MAKSNKAKVSLDVTLDAQLDAEAKALVDHFTKYTRKNYGPRCGEFEPDCCVCKIWMQRDLLSSFICS